MTDTAARITIFTPNNTDFDEASIWLGWLTEDQLREKGLNPNNGTTHYIDMNDL